MLSAVERGQPVTYNEAMSLVGRKLPLSHSWAFMNKFSFDGTAKCDLESVDCRGWRKNTGKL